MRPSADREATPLNHSAFHRRVAILVLGAGVGLAGCHRERPAPPDVPPPVVTVTRPVAHPVQAYYEYNGNLGGVGRGQAPAGVKGFLKETPSPEGEGVKRGALLFGIAPGE